jgi:TonB family protein
MCCKNYSKRIISFALTLILGLLAESLLGKENFDDKNQENITPLNKIIYRDKEGTGAASCAHSPIKSDAFVDLKPAKQLRLKTGKLQIISKPMARFTDNARRNETEGSVRLRVVFTASGQIGNIIPVSGLPDGLTEQAIIAARQIKFEPATRNNKPITETKIVEYKFTIY